MIKPINNIILIPSFLTHTKIIPAMTMTKTLTKLIFQNSDVRAVWVLRCFYSLFCGTTISLMSKEYFQIFSKYNLKRIKLPIFLAALHLIGSFSLSLSKGSFHETSQELRMLSLSLFNQDCCSQMSEMQCNGKMRTWHNDNGNENGNGNGNGNGKIRTWHNGWQWKWKWK